MLAARKVPGALKWIEDRRENLLVGRPVPPRARHRADGLRRRRHASSPPRSTTCRTSAPTRCRGRCRPAMVVGLLFPGPYRVPEATLHLHLGLLQHRRAAPPTGARGSSSRSPARCCSTSPPARWASTRSSCAGATCCAGDELPYANPNGMPYSDITPLETFEHALEMLDYEAFRREQARARAAGPLPRRRAPCTYVEPTTSGMGFLRHRGRDDPHRAVGQGERLRRRRVEREQPRDDRRPAHRRRARRRHRRRQHHPGRHRGHARSARGTGGSRSGSMIAGAVAETAVGAARADRWRSPRTSSRRPPTTSSSPAGRAHGPGHARRRAVRWPRSPTSPTSSPASLPPGVPAGPGGQRPLPGAGPDASGPTRPTCAPARSTSTPAR